MGELLTFSNKDSLISTRFWNSQLACKLYHEAYSKPFDSQKYFLKGNATPRCILFHQDVIVKVEDFNKELLPTEPVRIKVESAFPGLNYHRKSFFPLPKAYFESQGASSDSYILGLTKLVDEELEDHVRYFVETCDTFEGFQMFSEFHNYYEKGFFANLLEFLSDEYSKRPVVNFSSKQVSIKEDDYYRDTADLHWIGSSLDYDNYSCVPMGWGFEGEWTAQDYSFESVCAIGASIFTSTEHRDRRGLKPISIGFVPEYLEKNDVFMDLFDFTASKQEAIKGDHIVYGLRNKDGYVPHNYTYSFDQNAKIHNYLKELLKNEKPHYLSKNNLERDVLENIHSLIDQ